MLLILRQKLLGNRIRTLARIRTLSRGNVVRSSGVPSPLNQKSCNALPGIAPGTARRSAPPAADGRPRQGRRNSTSRPSKFRREGSSGHCTLHRAAAVGATRMLVEGPRRRPERSAVALAASCGRAGAVAADPPSTGEAISGVHQCDSPESGAASAVTCSSLSKYSPNAWFEAGGRPRRPCHCIRMPT